jgi:hypothetical protein
LTWIGVLFAGFLWVAYAGDLGGPNHLYRQIEIHYSPNRRPWIVLLFFFAAFLLTWRFMVSGLAFGLSGRKRYYRAANVLTATFWVSGFVALIWSNQPEHPFHFYDLWPWIQWLPLLLGLAVVARMSLGAWAWNRVHRSQILSRRRIIGFLAGWAAATSLLAALIWIAFPNTAWLRHLALLTCLLTVPLAGPGLAMLALGRNRSGGRE